MKKPLFYLDQYEKQRILEMHKKATNRAYLKEEKQLLNEFWLTLLGIGLAAGGAAALYKNWDSLTGQNSKAAFSQINKGCDNPEANKLKSFNSQKDYEDIAKKLNKSFQWGVLGFDFGTHNDDVTAALKRVKSIGDYCKLKKEYEKFFTDDLGEILMDEIDNGFDSIVMNALSSAVKKTMEVDGNVPGYKKIGDDGVDRGSSESDPNAEKEKEKEKGEDDGISYVACTNSFYKGCKDPMYGSNIKKLQRCLGLEPSGNFDSKTENAVKGETGKTTINSSDISDICGDL